MPEQGTTQSVERVLLLLEQLSAGGAMGVTELATVTGLNKATVFRLLATLSARGYVRKQSGSDKYTLTLKILGMSARLLDSLDVREVVHEDLRRLSDTCQETVHLVQREGSQIVYIDKVECRTNSVRMVSRIGLRGEMYNTGVGKSILAALPDEEIRRIWEKTPRRRCTPRTILELSAFMDEIGRIRQQGFAVDDEENELGVRCVAACCPDYSGRVRYAFSVSAPAVRMDEQRLQAVAQEVLSARDAIRQKLGGR